MSQCFEQCAVCGRTTGPEGPKQKNAATRIAREARRVCDVFVVGGATAVGYLWVCLSEICARSVMIVPTLCVGMHPVTLCVTL
ncbi:hypothetical protein EMIT0P228_30008 [Pseudomonas brassicacearum]